MSLPPASVKFVPASEIDQAEVEAAMRAARPADAENPFQIDPLSSGSDAPPSRLEFQAMLARVKVLENRVEMLLTAAQKLLADT